MDRIASYLNALPRSVAEVALVRCCASTRWARRLTRQRPFADDRHLFDLADEIWFRLETKDWLEAFAAHPRIGERETESQADVGTETWSRQEQAGVDKANYETKLALYRTNREYERRFDHVFLICATGKSAEEMLISLQQRLSHSPEEELKIAAIEQAKITQLRLHKLLKQPTKNE